MRSNRQCLKRQGILVVLVVFALFVTVRAWADPQKIISAIDVASPSCKVVSEKIFEYKELGQKEVKSSALLMEELRKLGFTVTGNLNSSSTVV